MVLLLAGASAFGTTFDELWKDIPTGLDLK
jgi:hypothetical protein